MLKRNIFIWSLSFTSALTQPVFAEGSSGDSLSDTGDAQIVGAIHATRLDYSKFDSPEAVTVLTREDIQAAGYLDVSEIFRSVPGFRIVKIGDESRVSYHGTAVRENRRMRVTINGRNVLIGDGQYVEFDRLPIAIEDISRVVVTRGANGAAYGDNAFLANIDFETVGRNDPHGSAVRVSGGNNARRKYSAGTNQTVGGFDVNLSASREHNGGYDYQDEQGTPRNDGKNVDRGQFTVSRLVSGLSLFEFNTSAYSADNKIGVLNQTGLQKNGGEFFELSNKTNLGENSRLDIAVARNHQTQRERENGCLTPATISAWMGAISDPALRGQLAGAIAGVSAALGVPASQVCFYDDLNVESTRTDAELEIESHAGPWRYVAGASLSKVDAKSDQYFAGVEEHQRTNRIFAEGSYGIGSLHFSAGGMAQHSDNVAHTEYAGRAAINWAVVPNQSLRYTYSDSFRVPSLLESVTRWKATFCFRRESEPLGSSDFCQSPPNLITSSYQVKPEHIEDHSVGYYGTFLGDALTIDVKAFHDRITDPITSNYFFFSPPPSNGAAFTLQGIETAVALRLTNRWSVQTQYSYLDNDATQSFELGMQGKNAGSLTVVYRPIRTQSIGVSYYVNSEISGNDYRRLDLAYNYTHEFVKSRLILSAVYQRHITNVDGIASTGTLGTNEGIYRDRNQLFGSIALEF